VDSATKILSQQFFLSTPEGYQFVHSLNRFIKIIIVLMLRNMISSQSIKAVFINNDTNRNLSSQLTYISNNNKENRLVNEKSKV
jgi:hypothetical protein